MTILEHLWRGNISPCNRVVKHGSIYESLSREADKYEGRFKSELSEEGQEAYNNFYKCLMGLYDIAECDDFICGFRLGMQITLQATGENQTQLPPL